MNAATPASPVPPPAAAATPTSPSPKSFDPLMNMGTSNGNNAAPNAPISPNVAQMQQMQMAYQQNMMMMQQQMQQMQMAQQQQANFQRQGSGGGAMPAGMMPPTMPMMGTPNMTANKQPIMGANYMRQVPGVAGDKMSSFSFLGSDPKKQDNKSFDFVKDQMKRG